jgi:hypothetical protein
VTDAEHLILDLPLDIGEIAKSATKQEGSIPVVNQAAKGLPPNVWTSGYPMGTLCPRYFKILFILEVSVRF